MKTIQSLLLGLLVLFVPLNSFAKPLDSNPKMNWHIVGVMVNSEKLSIGADFETLKAERESGTVQIAEAITKPDSLTYVIYKDLDCKTGETKEVMTRILLNDSNINNFSSHTLLALSQQEITNIEKTTFCSP